MTQRLEGDSRQRGLAHAVAWRKQLDREARTARDGDDLLWSLCRVVLDVTGIELAWVGLAEADERRTVRPLAHAGRRPEAEHYVRQLDVTWSDDARGRGPTGTAVRERRPTANDDTLANPVFAPWRVHASSLGLRSSLAIPFDVPDRGVGTLNVYASQPHAFGDDEIAMLVHLVLDIEQRLAVFEARHQQRELVSALSAARAELAASEARGGHPLVDAAVVHDLRNLLTVVQSHAAMLARASQGSEEIVGLLSAVERARELAQALGSPPEGARAAEHDLVALVSELELLLGRALGDGVRLELRLPSEPVVARVDGAALQRSLLNLAINARDAMPGQGCLHIEVGVTRRRRPRGKLDDAAPEHHAFVAVTDDGSGIDPEILPRIFEPYFTTKAKKGGTGLGLWTVKRTLEAQDGWIEVCTEPGWGSTFTMFVPLAPRSPIAARRGTTILLVEDERAIRWCLGGALRDAGYAVVEAVSLAEARARAFELGDDLDLVVTDFGLPDGDGATLLDELTRERPSLRGIGMTGYGPEAFGPTTPILQKPFALEELIERVGAVAQPVVLDRGSSPHPTSTDAVMETIDDV